MSVSSGASTLTPARNYNKEYSGNKVYKNGTLSMILTEEGFATLSGTAPTYYYYLKDHQGNNRVVINQSGTVQQVNHYYAFGGQIGEGMQSSNQPYKYNGKEFDRFQGLDLYDYGARHYDAALGRWFTVDPMAEKYYSISSYVYVGNNPINNIDLCGDSITYILNSTINNPDGTTSIISSSYYYGQDASGNYGFIDTSGYIYSGNDGYLNNLSTAINNLRTGGNVGNALVGDLMNSTNTVQVVQGRNTADSNGTFIRWNPNSTTGGMNALGNENRPSYIGLGHEMAHIQDTWNGSIDNSPWVTVGNVTIPNSEKYATHTNGVSPNGIPLLATPFVYWR